LTLSAPPAFVNSGTPTLTVTETDNRPLPAGSQVALDITPVDDPAGAVELTGQLVNGQVSFTPATPLAEGAYTVKAHGTDGAGNERSSAEFTFPVDPTAPTVVLDAPAVTNDPTPLVTVTATDNNPLPDGTLVAIDLGSQLGQTTATLVNGTAA